MRKRLPTVIQVLCHVTVVLFFGSEYSHGIQLRALSYYDGSSDKIVVTLTCSEHRDSACPGYNHSSTINWLAIDGTQVLNVTSGFKLSGKILSTRITTTMCTSNLLLWINPNVQYATPPQLQCEIKNKVGQILARSKRKHPKILIDIQPATLNMTAFRGTNVTISCPLGNDLPPLVIKNMRALWWKKSLVLPSSNMTLFLMNVTEADEGWIECQPTGNELYRAGEKSSWVYLTVKGPLPKPTYFRLGSNVTCNERVSLVWEWPNNTFTMNITAEINCSFLDNVVSSPIDSEAKEIALSKNFTYGSCRIRFRNPAGISEYSDSVLVCRSVEPSKLPLLILAGAGIIAITMIFYVAYKKDTWTTLKEYLIKRCCTASAPVETQQSKSTAQVQNEKLDEILVTCKTTNRALQEIVDQRNTTPNNEVNQMGSGASVSIGEPSCNDDEAISEAEISQETDRRNETHAHLEVGKRSGEESEV